MHKMLEEQDPQAAERIHPNNIKKIIRALERLHEGEENVKSFQQVQQETTDYETILTRTYERSGRALRPDQPESGSADSSKGF